MNRPCAAVLGLLLLAASPHASALCTLTCSCSVSTTPVAFGGYDPLSGSPQDATGNVRVTCGGVLGLLVPFDIALDAGSFGAGLSPRQMASGANRLNYDLYTAAAHTVVWGDGSGASQMVAGSVTIILLGGTSVDHPIYGRIPGGQSSVPPGSYGDTVTVTVTYY